MTRLAWLTDIHLDHLKPRPQVRQAFAEMVAEDSDCCVITGDISTYNDAFLLSRFADHYQKPIYFVLGNHDFWGGNFLSTYTQIREMCSVQTNLHWLTDSDPIDIADGVQLCGVDGWYDARFGSWRDSNFTMLDWRAIRDFYFGNMVDIVAKSRAVADRLAFLGLQQLRKTTAPHVIFATHVPPYELAAFHEGQPSSRISLPWYTSKVTGERLDAWVQENRSRKLTTLCGHTHSSAAYRRDMNHLVLAGSAEYGAPVIQRVFEL